MACNYGVHTVKGKLLDQFFFMSMDSTFNVTCEFLQVYQTPDCLNCTRFNVLVTVNVASYFSLSSDLQDYGAI